MKISIHPMPEALPADLRAALAEISFPTIGHFLEEGFVDPAIRAMVTPAKIVGRAVTVRITAPDSVLVHKATEMLEPGDALVIDIGGDARHAPVGEMVALAVRERGGAEARRLSLMASAPTSSKSGRWDCRSSPAARACSPPSCTG